MEMADYIYNQSYATFEFHLFDAKLAIIEEFMTWWVSHLNTIQWELLLDVVSRIAQDEASLSTKVKLSMQGASDAPSAFPNNKVFF